MRELYNTVRLDQTRLDVDVFERACLYDMLIDLKCVYIFMIDNECVND